jgi:lysophospholipase L1-like esterase
MHLFDDGNFEYHPDVIWSPKPMYSVFNPQGFRGPELATERSPGRFRIFAIGDSNTLGWAGDDGANWPADLAGRLGAAGLAADVVNAGVWGYSSWQGVRRLRQVLPFAPDIVLVSFGSNDAHLVRQSDSEYDARSLRRSELGRTLERFRLGELILSVLDGAAQAGDLRPRVGLDDYRQHLRTMVAEAKAQGTKVVLLTRPYVGPIEHPLWWKNRGADYNTATIEVAAELGVPVIDVYSYFKGRDRLFADESHFTAEGHRLAAQFIYDGLRGTGLF